ncbi:MAG: hypothetical protein AAF909_03705 [Pseudomonadota bacterium]
MRLIAHRVFEDHRPTAAFDPLCLKGFDGAEFDLRSGEDGETYVFHAPFMPRPKATRRTPNKRLDESCQLLARAPAPPRILILDIKTLGAAEHAAEFVASGGLQAAGLHETQPVFLCWHTEEMTTLRRALPEATILFVIAPIQARRLLRMAPSDLYAANHFPFLAAAGRFRPRRGKYNSHNINVRLLRKGAPPRLAPDDADGVCLLKRFLSPPLVEAAAAHGLQMAVFGWRSAAEAKSHALAEAVDYAIIRGPKTAEEAEARRKLEARRRLNARRRTLRRMVRA